MPGQALAETNWQTNQRKNPVVRKLTVGRDSQGNAAGGDELLMI
jgi:hypothetical protein